MKTLVTDFSPELLAEAVAAVIAAPITTESLRAIHEKSKELYLYGDPIESGIPFSAKDIWDEDGQLYPELRFQILSVYLVDGDRWISGSEFKLNLSNYFRVADAVYGEALSRKVDGPEDLDLTGLL